MIPFVHLSGFVRIKRDPAREGPSKLWWVRYNHCSLFRNIGQGSSKFGFINISVYVSGDIVVKWKGCGLPGQGMNVHFLSVQLCSFLHSGSISLLRFSMLPKPKALKITVGERVCSVYFSKCSEGRSSSFIDCFAFWKFHQFFELMEHRLRMQVFWEHWSLARVSPIRVVCLELIDSLEIWLEISNNALISCLGMKCHRNDTCIAFQGMLHAIWVCLLRILGGNFTFFA